MTATATMDTAPTDAAPDARGDRERAIDRFAAGLRREGYWVSPDGRCNPDAAAWSLGVSPGCLRNWRASENNPLPFVARPRVTYKIADLLDYIDGNAYDTITTDDAA